MDTLLLVFLHLHGTLYYIINYNRHDINHIFTTNRYVTRTILSYYTSYSSDNQFYADYLLTFMNRSGPVVQTMALAWYYFVFMIIITLRQRRIMKLKGQKIYTCLHSSGSVLLFDIFINTYTHIIFSLSSCGIYGICNVFLSWE